MSSKVIATIVLLVLLLIFAIQNTPPVVLNFLFWQIATSSILSILMSFIIGSLIDVDFGDRIDFLGDDQATKSILIYMESVATRENS